MIISALLQPCYNLLHATCCTVYGGLYTPTPLAAAAPNQHQFQSKAVEFNDYMSLPFLDSAHYGYASSSELHDDRLLPNLNSNG